MTFSVSVLVSGRGTNLSALIEAEHQEYKISQVVTDTPGCPATRIAQEQQIPVVELPWQKKTNSRETWCQELLSVIQDHQPNLVVLAGFMKLLSPDFVSALEGKLINIHPSLLPAYPGSNANEQAFAAKEEVSGCTVHYVDAGCDTGKIIAQAAVSTKGIASVQEFSARVLTAEHILLPTIVRKFAMGTAKCSKISPADIEKARQTNQITFSDSV